MKLLVLTTLLAAGQSQSIVCEDGGRYQADPYQCDKYYYCDEEGQRDPAEILCRDGLVFDPYSRSSEPCDHTFNIDCGDKRKLQDPQGTVDECYRLNGYYSHPDLAVCNIFYSCEDGEPTEYKCPPGLWYSDFSGTCVWPNDAGREDETGVAPCGTIHEDVNGFTCPYHSEAELVIDPHPRYADNENCEFFYVCLNGDSPRHQGCDNGEVYNDETKRCDDVENVPECQAADEDSRRK